MSIGVNSPSNLEVTAYHEAGHTTVAKVLEKQITSIMLFHIKQADIWEGASFYNPHSDIDSLWAMRDLDRFIPYRELRLQYPGHPYPYDEYKDVRDTCIIKYAGLVTEALLYKQLGIDENLVVSGESTKDIRDARELLAQRFPLEEWEKELLNAETRAREILSNPTCWKMAENLAKELVSAILQGKNPLRQEDHHDVYKFSDDEVYESFARTLTQGNTHNLKDYL